MKPRRGNDSKLTSGTAGVIAAIVVLAALVLLLGWGLGSPRAEPEARSAAPAARAAQAGAAPVVMVVFDEFPLTSLLGRGGRIDARRYPNFAALAGDSTWFANATGVHDRTTKAVPAILTGGLPRGGKLPVARDHPRSLFSWLRGSHALNVSEEATALCAEPCGGSGRAIAAARGNLRAIELAIIQAIHHGRAERFADWVGRIRAGGRPQLSFKHLFLPHTPFKFLPSGRHYLENWRERLPGLSEHRLHSPWLAGQANQRHLLNLAYTDRLIGMLLRRLRRQGLYDRSLIVLTADHGASFQRAQDRRIVTRRTYSDIASIPLIVKRPFQRDGVVSRSYVRTTDILPTIAQGLGRALPWRVQGRSAFGRGVRGRRSVFTFRGAEATVSRVPREPRVRLSVRAFERSQRRALRRQLRFFGSGDANRIFRFGPYQRQLGRAVSELPVVPGGRWSASLRGGRLLRSVTLRGRFVPAQIVGLIRGPRRLGRAVAVAINGRIAAVGHTFALPGGRRERFSLVVPDWRLRQGSNEVRVYGIAGPRSAPRLRLLGGN